MWVNCIRKISANCPNIYYYYYNVIGIPCHVLTNTHFCVDVKHTNIVIERATTTAGVATNRLRALVLQRFVFAAKSIKNIRRIIHSTLPMKLFPFSFHSTVYEQI